MKITIATEFSDFLVNRDEFQGDGTFTGVEFRTQFLAPLEAQDWWKNSSEELVLDFDKVDTIGPSWANEVFAYYTDAGRTPTEILKKIKFQKISPVKLNLIKTEIAAGYKKT